MRAAFDDAALIEHQDPVRVSHGGKTMRDDDAGAPLHQSLERFVHQSFAFAVECGGGFVQKQNTRVGQNCTRDGDALTLPAREFHATRTHHGVHAFGQAVDELGRVRQAAGLANFILSGTAFSVTDIFVDRPAKQQNLLRHDRHLRANRTQRNFLRLTAVEKDSACIRIAKTKDQRKHGRFPRARRTDQGDSLTRLHGKRKVIEHACLGPRRIAERNPLELHRAMQRRSVVTIRALGLGIE